MYATRPYEHRICELLPHLCLSNAITSGDIASMVTKRGSARVRLHMKNATALMLEAHFAGPVWGVGPAKSGVWD